MIRSDFQSFFVSFQLIIPTKVFHLNDMTYFNICMYMCRRPVSWASVWSTQNDLKGAVCGEAPSMHISYHPISYFQYDIYMPRWENGTFKRTYYIYFSNDNGNSKGNEFQTKSQIHFHFLFKIANDIFFEQFPVLSE